MSPISVGWPWWVLIGIVLLFIVFGCTIYCLPKCLVEPYLNKHGVLCSLKHIQNYRERKLIAITIDDVPLTRDSFQEILDLFKKYNMKMSCFVISDYINDATKELLMDAINDGHLLCNHGKADTRHALLPMDALKAEINGCELKLKELYDTAGIDSHAYDADGSGPKFYRPGSGAFTQPMLTFANSKRYTLVLGNTYPSDPWCRSARCNRLYLKFKIEPGDIIIIHDRKWAADTLKRLLPWIKRKGYECVTLDQIA